MPFYEVITPLRNGGKEPIQPGGDPVELPKKEGDALVAIGALSGPVKKPAAAKVEPPKA